MNTAHYQELLEAEKAKLIGELSSIGTRNPTNPADWDAMPADTAELDSHEDVTDRLTENEEQESIEKTLEERLKEVETALEKITTPKDGQAFGLCEVCNEPIEEDRLEANPAARTCKAHLND